MLLHLPIPTLIVCFAGHGSFAKKFQLATKFEHQQGSSFLSLLRTYGRQFPNEVLPEEETSRSYRIVLSSTGHTMIKEQLAV